MYWDLSNAKLVTHKDCCDGSTCAILFVIAGGSLDNVIFSSPNHSAVDEIAKDLFYSWDGNIVFADISFSEEVAKMFETRDNVVLLDHHKSAIPLAKYSFAEIDVQNNRCGAKVLYDWLRVNTAYSAELSKYRELVDLVDDRDRWINQYPESVNITNLHGCIDSKLFVQRFLKNPSVEMSVPESYLLEVERHKESEFIKRKKSEVVIRNKRIKDKDYRVAFVKAGGPYRSSLGSAICNDMELNVDFVVMVNGDHVSMRSRGSDVDLSEICSLNGGGGHKAAAACSFDAICGTSILDMVIDNLKLP